MSISSSRVGSSLVQSQLWGARALDWANDMEGQMSQLYEAVLETIGVGQGTELLDAGCGAGLAAQIATGRGAVVTGFDATPQPLEIARSRVPSGEFACGDLEALPYADDAFDAVVGFNSFQYAAKLAERRRLRLDPLSTRGMSPPTRRSSGGSFSSAP